MNYVTIYESEMGGRVELHLLHGRDELENNLEACKVLADNGYQIQLLPSLPSNEVELRKKLLPDVFGNKNPDIRINNSLIGDIKTPDKNTIVKKSTISREIRSVAKQKAEIAIINLLDRVYSVQDIKKGIVGALQPDRNRCIKSVWVITKKRNVFIVNRIIVFNDSIYEALNNL
jgi:hypothetical protein